MPAGWAVGRDPVEIGLGTAVGALGIATLAGFLGHLAWWLDLVAPFHLHFAVAALAVAAVAIALKRFRWVALCGLLIAANVMPAEGFLGSGSIAAPRGVLTVASVNMNTHNPSPEKVLTRLRDDPVDVVVLSEFRPAWQPLLAPLADIYPYRYVAPTTTWKGAERGQVLLSRWPFRGVAPISAAGDRRVLGLRIVVGRVTLFAVHLLHPLPPASPAISAAERATLAKAVRAETRPVAVIGDFNMTPYQAAYADFVAATGLHRATAGVTATFPAKLGLLGLPIDYLLLGNGVKGSFRAVPAPGSDHRMLRGWIEAPAPPAAAPASQPTTPAANDAKTKP